MIIKKVLKYFFVFSLTAAFLLGGVRSSRAEEIVLHGQRMRLTFTGDIDVMLYDAAGSPVISISHSGEVEDYSLITGNSIDVSAERKADESVIIYPVDFDGSIGITANTANPGHILVEEVISDSSYNLIARRDYRYVAGVSDTIRLADLYADSLNSKNEEESDGKDTILMFLLIGLGVIMLAMIVPLIILLKNKKEEEMERAGKE